MTEKYTLGIPEDIVKEKGILQLLLENGIKQLEHLQISGSKYKPVAGTSSYRTKYSKVRLWHVTMFEAKEDNIFIVDYLNDCIAHGFPIDRQANNLSFEDLNGHIFRLEKRGYHKYRVSHIDGKSVLDSYTKEDILRLMKGSVFEKITSGICKIYRKKAPRAIDYDCDWIETKG